MPYLENNRLRVALDESSPRILSFTHKSLNLTVPGFIPGVSDAHYLFVRHQAGIADSTQLGIECRDGRDSVDYRITAPTPDGDASFTLRWELTNDSLCLRMTDFHEPGDARIINVDLEANRLLSSKDTDLWIATEEWVRPKKDFHFHHARFYDFVTFGKENWAAAIWTNKPFQPCGLDWIPWPKTRNDDILWAALRFPVYHHRIKGRVQPDFEGEIAILTDRNGDGIVDWQDAADWVRTHIKTTVPELYKRAMVTKFSIADPNYGVFTTFKQCLEKVREFARLTEGTLEGEGPRLIAYLSGWQHEGHDSKWPSVSEVCKDAGGLKEIMKLIGETRELGVNISVHLNVDDAYADSPAWDPEIIAIGRNGEFQKGAVWGGGQSYRISSYKDFVSGSAERRLNTLLDLLPLKDTVHIDVFAVNPYTESFDPAPDEPSSQMENLVIGRWGIVDLYNQQRLDITSEGFSWPFLGKLGYFWHLGSGHHGRVLNHLLHGHAGFGGEGGGRGIPKDLKRYLMECILPGCNNSTNFIGDDDVRDMVTIYYLLHLPWSQLADVEIRRQGNDGGEVFIEFTDGSSIRGSREKQTYEISLADRLIAKDFTIAVPLGKDRIIAYSLEGGRFLFPAPADWNEKDAVECILIGRTGTANAALNKCHLILEIPPCTGAIIRASSAALF